MQGCTRPKHFAAIATIVGGIRLRGPKDVTPVLKQWVANLATVIAFAFAGAKDKFVPAERSQPMVGAIRDAGGRQVELKVHPNEWQAAS